MSRNPGGFRDAPPPLVAPPGHALQTSVLMHDEPIALAPAPVLGFRPTLLGQLLAAHDTEERRRTVTAMLHDLGFDWLGYGQMRPTGDRAVPLSFCTTYAHAGWTQRYFQQRYHQVDPRLHQALRTTLPYVWTLDSLVEQGVEATDEALLARFIKELHTVTGTRCGVMLSLPGPGRDRGYVSLLSRRPDVAWIDDGVVGRVLTFAMCLHEFYSRHVPLPRAATAPRRVELATLSPLQHEILALLAKGLADKQIAGQLNLSLYNVDYHLRRLRQRFGVRNRVQLMQAATRTSSEPLGAD